MTQRIAVVGSRHFQNADLVTKFIASLDDSAIVLSGGAQGVDTMAERCARQRSLKVEIFTADWERYGSKAGPMRNARIVAEADKVVAFWDGKSRGTLNSVVQMVESGKPALVFDEAGDPVALEDVLDAAKRLGVLASMERAKRRAAQQGGGGTVQNHDAHQRQQGDSGVGGA